MKRIAIMIACAALLNACGGGSDQAEPQASVSSALVSSFATAQTSSAEEIGTVAMARIEASLRSATGPVDVWVELGQASAAVRQSAKLDVAGTKLTGGEARAARAEVRAQQDATANSLNSLGAEVLGRVELAHNLIAVRVDAKQLGAIASLPGVVRVEKVVHYELMLAETVPYVGAAAAHALGRDGRGTRIAILDSGLDYTHAAFGGPGTPAAYAAARADPEDPAGLFPTAKAIGGFDFVGQVWPNGPRTEDPDPIDSTVADHPVGGHGTHVAHIAAGIGGTAPRALLYAVKVCSAVANSCNGIAIAKGFDFALDPNGDGDISDAVDVVNLSLGANYGQQENSLTQAANNAVQAGVIVVAAAGNAGDVPYIVASPSVAASAISVAQTQVPSAIAQMAALTVSPPPAGQPNPNPNVGVQPWAPPTSSPTSGQLVYLGRGCPAGSGDPPLPADDPYLADPAGRIALIDRGICNASVKVDRAATAGAIGVIIADNVAAAAPFIFGFGGGTNLVPTVSVTLAYGNAVKAVLSSTEVVKASFQLTSETPLVGSIVSTSSRGPSVGNVMIKPEIGAPGASVSAESGTGTGTTPFGGTSGATPMVTGAMAILKQEHPTRSPMVLKALVMNSADPDIRTNPIAGPDLAPITRIGAGELRVDRALALEAAAWVPADKSAALSFGFQALTSTETFERTIRVQNLVRRDLTFDISSNFRYASDAATGAVTLSMPSSITVPARGSATFTVTMTIDPSRLPAWTLTNGNASGSPAQLTAMEVDGYVTLSSEKNTMTLPWHVLPRRAAAVVATPGSLVAGNNITIANPSATSGRADVFALTGTSPRDERPDEPNIPYIDLRAVGIRYGGVNPTFGDLIEFAVTTFGARSTPVVPALFSIFMDVDRDGIPDYEVFNGGVAGGPGQSAAFARNLRTGVTRGAFFVVGGLNTSNMILTIPLSFLQDPAPSPQLTLNTQFDFDTAAIDNYFTGSVIDFIDVMTHTLSTPHFTPAAGALIVPPGVAGFVGTSAVPGGAAASPSQIGVLLVYSPADPRRNSEADIIRLREPR